MHSDIATSCSCRFVSFLKFNLLVYVAWKCLGQHLKRLIGCVPL